MLATAIISALGLAAIAVAAPQGSNNAGSGIYICPRANFGGDAPGTSTACVWLVTKNPECFIIPSFGMAEDAERHISLSPDTGNFCTLFESGRCNKTQPHIDVIAPGFHDLWQKHLDMGTNSQYKTAICSTKDAADPLDHANV